MAIRFLIALGTSAESWQNQPFQCELWYAEQQRKDLKARRLVAA